MSESQDRKTEKPTQRKLRQAREEGDVAFSRDVSSTVALTAVFVALWIGSALIINRASLLGTYALESPQRLAIASPEEAGYNSALEVFWIVSTLVFPIAAIAALAAIAVNIWQTRGLFSVKAVKPRPERINPAEGLKQIFSRRNLIELLKTIIKVVLLALTLFLVIRWSLQTMVKLPTLSIDSRLSVSAILFAVFFGAAVIILAVIAFFDIWFQQYEYIHRNKMTPEELKRERRDDLGDPYQRAERRKIALQDAGESLLERTARSTLIINAATEGIAVAIAVDADNPDESWVVNKGASHVAAAILAVGREAGIRIVDNTPMATALHKNVQINDDIPASFAQAIRQALS